MMLPALSIRQPWAHAILYLGKNIENRNWKHPYRGRFYIHAGLKHDEKWRRAKNHKGRIILGHEDHSTLTWRGAWSATGGIIGSVRLVKITELGWRNQWFTGRYGYVLSDPKAYDHIIECKGRLGFFDPPKHLAKELMRAEQS